MSNSESFTSHGAGCSATHGEAAVRGWPAFVLVVACSPRRLTRQTAVLPGGSCARVVGLAASVGPGAKARSRARGGVDRLRVLCGLAPLACGVLLMLASLPPEALASTNWPTGVEASLPANANTSPNAGVESVSCASAANCSAVGTYTDSSGHSQGLLLTETSGTWATGVEASWPANARTQPHVSLGPVSCASAGNCTAVANATGLYNESQGLLLTETSGRWATGVEPPLPANANTDPEVSLGSASCASAGNCTAVGNYTDSSGTSDGLLLTETSGTWAPGDEASVPTNAYGEHPDVSLGSVSCASAGNCTAVGSYIDSSGDYQGLLLTETSGTWAPPVEASLPANAGEPASGGGTQASVSLGSVSCASAGNCTAVGIYIDSSGQQQGLLLTETSGTWATGVEASLPANPRTQPEVSLNSVSCASAGNCSAVGNYIDSSGQYRGLLLTETSGTWTAGVEASLPANADVYSVSCASAGNCSAGSSTDITDSSGHSQGLLLTETSGTWATGVEASLPANANTSANASVNSVSCASAGNCSAVGDYTDSSGHQQGLLLGLPTVSGSAPSAAWHAGLNLGSGPLSSAPAVGVDSARDEFVFWQGAGRGLWEKHYIGGKWSARVRIRSVGKIASAPAVAVRGVGQQDVFWKGLNGHLWEARYTHGWHTPVDLGAGRLASAPTVGVDAAGDEFVFWRGADSRLWEKSYHDGRWNRAVRVTSAGRLGSAPAVAVHANGQADVFWKGSDGNLWEAVHSHGWRAGTNLGGGPLGSAPAAGVDSAGEEFVFWRGTDDGLWEKFDLHDRWNASIRITTAGTIGSAPAVAVHRNGQQDVFWKGVDRNLWESFYQPS
jgi:hypothetical protein